ncbi:MAG TPA: hypothetical protein VJN22_05220 [Candidatus Eremiobacteraceae bacterium]|nr:hypothetical protein [Candidatus Eremiobacteraceae bacterium]
MKVLQSGRVKLFAFLAIGIVGGSLAAGPLPPAFGKVFEGQRNVKPNIVFTGNQSGPTLKSINNGTGSAITAQAVGGPGIFGQSVTGGGIVGSSTSGYGLTGTSASNIGLNGSSTSNYGVGGSTHASFPFAGVFGTSLASSGFPTGLYGTEPTSGAGTYGECTSATAGANCFGLLAQVLGAGGTAIEGFTFAGSDPALTLVAAGGGPIANFSGSTSLSDTFGNNGLLTISVPAGQAINVGGINDVSLFTDANGSPTGSDVGLWTNATGFGLVSEHQGTGVFPALYLNTSGAEGVNNIILAQNTGNGAFMTLDDNGNETLSGHITTAGGTLDRVHSPGGPTMDTYGARHTVPTIEDFGQGQLVNGVGYVTIDATFGSTIDFRRPYLVFVTPDGDNNGLYVTGKTVHGFAVREARGGRSTLAFDYRIVAKPIDENGARLPVDNNAQIRFARPIPSSADAKTLLRRMSAHMRFGSPTGGNRARPRLPQ